VDIETFFHPFLNPQGACFGCLGLEFTSTHRLDIYAAHSMLATSRVPRFGGWAEEFEVSSGIRRSTLATPAAGNSYVGARYEAVTVAAAGGCRVKERKTSGKSSLPTR